MPATPAGMLFYIGEYLVLFSPISTLRKRSASRSRRMQVHKGTTTTASPAYALRDTEVSPAQIEDRAQAIPLDTLNVTYSDTASAPGKRVAAFHIHTSSYIPAVGNAPEK